MKFTYRNVYVSPRASIGSNVQIGDNTSIYDNVIVGDNSVIANDCVIGEPTADYYAQPAGYDNPPTVIGSGSLIRSHAIIYSGVQLGDGFSCGHRVTIREQSVFGIGCRVGTLCDIQGFVDLGDYCWLHSSVHIGQRSSIGHFVFVYPFVVFTNDPTPPSSICIGPTVGDYSQIAVSSILLPGVTIGRHCLVGAGSVVRADLEDFYLALGNPAKPVKRVTDITSRESGISHYPWPYHFDRGMPWEGQSFDSWIRGQDKYEP